MRCPRCGEDNMPGLKLCLGCGWNLAEDPADLQIRTVPRVRERNPLQRRRPARRCRRRVRVSEQGLRVARELLAACLLGLLPGLGPILRGERRQAAILVGAMLACGLAWLLLWHSLWQPVAWMGALSVMATGALLEARARIPDQGVAWNLAAVGFSVSLALSVHVAAAFAYDTLLPRVILPDQPALAGGHFLVERVSVADLAFDDLVAVGQRQTLWQVTDEPVLVGPVLGLPGQWVDSDADGLRVDGAPVVVHPPNPEVPLPELPEGPVLVPAGQVAVVLATIRVLPVEDLLGRVHYRWMPPQDRGPLRWPPLPPDAVEPP